MEYELECLTCKAVFKSTKQKKYCCHGCFAKRNSPVTKQCPVCEQSFTVEFRFRKQVTCSRACFRKHMSIQNKNRVTKQCPVCSRTFDVIKSREETGKYCSYECFLSTRKSQQLDVELTCENCKKRFTVGFIHASRRFCGKSCANTGEHNGMFGKPGPLTGLPAWNRGQTTQTDTRVALLGQKISQILKGKFASGVLSHVGDKNPNFGRTPQTRTPEQRDRYSRAAVERILSGVSGYTTGHVTGTYAAKKSLPVQFKSSWELAAMMFWDVDDSVVSYAYEPEIILLPSQRRSIPDFRVTFNDSSVTMFEIKPTAIQQITVVKEKLDHTRDVLAARGESYVLLGNVEIKAMIAHLGKEFEIAVQRYKNRS